MKLYQFIFSVVVLLFLILSGCNNSTGPESETVLWQGFLPFTNHDIYTTPYEDDYMAVYEDSLIIYKYNGRDSLYWSASEQIGTWKYSKVSYRFNIEGKAKIYFGVNEYSNETEYHEVEGDINITISTGQQGTMRFWMEFEPSDTHDSKLTNFKVVGIE